MKADTAKLTEILYNDVINVALYGSKNDYILYTDAKTIEVNEGVLLNQDRLYIDFKEAIVIDENKFTYSFFDYVNEIK